MNMNEKQDVGQYNPGSLIETPIFTNYMDTRSFNMFQYICTGSTEQTRCVPADKEELPIISYFMKIVIVVMG